MIKRIILFLLISVTSFAQTKNEKIKIILMGTFHYGATGDRNSTNFKDLFSEKRQKELEILLNPIAQIYFRGWIADCFECFARSV